MDLLFSDFHLKLDRLEEQKVLLGKIIELALKKNVKRIIFLGDMFNDRRHITVYELLVFKDFVSRLKALGIVFIAIAGNHDKPYNEAEISYLGIFLNSNEYIFEAKKLYRLKNFGFVSYFPDNILIDIIENYKYKDKIKYLFLHAGFRGARMNNGHKIKNKLTFDVLRDYKNLRKVFVGHYHVRQKLFNNKVYYIGNPYQLNFGEDENKRVYLFDNGKLKAIKLEYNKYEKHNFECTAEDYIKAMELVKNSINKHIKLSFVDDKEKLSSIPEVELLKNAKCMELIIDRDFYDFSKPEESQIDFGEDIMGMFKEYSKQENMSNEERIFGIKKLRKVGV